MAPDIDRDRASVGNALPRVVAIVSGTGFAVIAAILLTAGGARWRHARATLR